MRPRCERPRVHAKIEAIGFVEVGLPCWCWRKWRVTVPWAQIYDEARKGDMAYWKCIEGAVHYVDLQPGEIVLDAGCGTGLTIKQYQRPGTRVIASRS